MYAFLYTIVGHCVLAVAAPDNHKMQPHNRSLFSLLAQISSHSIELEPPPIIVSELTGIPASIISAIGNPSAISSLESNFIVNGAPAWNTFLPVDAKSYFMDVAPKIESILSLEIAAAFTDPTGVVATRFVNSTVSSRSSTKAITSLVVTVKASSTSTSALATKLAATNSSSAGTAPTGVIAAGVMGAVGFLGLALAL